jgi:hypothetical protein
MQKVAQSAARSPNTELGAPFFPKHLCSRRAKLLGAPQGSPVRPPNSQKIAFAADHFSAWGEVEDDTVGKWQPRPERPRISREPSWLR